MNSAQKIFSARPLRPWVWHACFSPGFPALNWTQCLSQSSSVSAFFFSPSEIRPASVSWHLSWCLAPVSRQCRMDSRSRGGNPGTARDVGRKPRGDWQGDPEGPAWRENRGESSKKPEILQTFLLKQAQGGKRQCPLTSSCEWFEYLPNNRQPGPTTGPATGLDHLGRCHQRV